MPPRIAPERQDELIEAVEGALRGATPFERGIVLEAMVLALFIEHLVHDHTAAGEPCEDLYDLVDKLLVVAECPTRTVAGIMAALREADLGGTVH